MRPEYSRIVHIRHFQDTIDIYILSYLELSPILNYISSRRVEELLTLDKRIQYQSMIAELKLRLLSYMNLSFILIEHTRRLYKKSYSKHNDFSNYEETVRATFQDDTLSQFVKFLRHYIVHRELPVIKTSHGWHQNSGWKHFAYIDGGDLLNWDGWNNAAKKYIIESGPNLDLQEIFSKYHDKNIGFYNYVYSCLAKAHAEDYDYVLKEQQRSNTLLGKKIPLFIRNLLKDKSQYGTPESLLVTLPVDAVKLSTAIHSNDTYQGKLEAVLAWLVKDYSVDQKATEILLQDVFSI